VYKRPELRNREDLENNFYEAIEESREKCLVNGK
jgi:hypothetical protein